MWQVLSYIAFSQSQEVGITITVMSEEFRLSQLASEPKPTLLTVPVTDGDQKQCISHLKKISLPFVKDGSFSSLRKLIPVK